MVHLLISCPANKLCSVRGCDARLKERNPVYFLGLHSKVPYNYINMIIVRTEITPELSMHERIYSLLFRSGVSEQ